jgi:hypothetical protein
MKKALNKQNRGASMRNFSHIAVSNKLDKTRTSALHTLLETLGRAARQEEIKGSRLERNR